MQLNIPDIPVDQSAVNPKLNVLVGRPLNISFRKKQLQKKLNSPQNEEISFLNPIITSSLSPQRKTSPHISGTMDKQFK